MRRLLPLTFIISLGLVVSSCKNDKLTSEDSEESTEFSEDKINLSPSIGVYDLKEDQAYRDKVKELDLKCPNLLDPRISKNEINLINQEWGRLNQTVGQYLVKNNFNWNTEASTVKVWHKFYFDKDGSITSYYFNVLDDSISEETRNAYRETISEIIDEQYVNIQKDSAFAQCGSMRFPVVQI